VDASVSQLAKPFQLPIRQRWLARLVERVLGLNALSRCYESAPKNGSTEDFLLGVLDHLEVKLKPVDRFNALENVPKEGPLLIVANHPLGGLEGVAITKLLLELRPDIKVLTNNLLRRIPELQSTFIGVDVLSKNAARENLKGIREASQHLKGGGALLLFPAGKVASVNMQSRSVEDHPWNRLAGNLLKRSNASCLPIHVDGYNSRFFYLMAMIHPLLRTLLLPRELANKKGRELKLIIGETISPREVLKLSDDRAVTDYLRMSTDFLKNHQQPAKAQTSLVFEPISVEDKISNDNVQLALNEIVDCRYIESEQYDVYCAPFERLGCLMAAIGVAREITFRAAGEGTGNSVDSDRFDPHYLHLFIWDKSASRVVGGYRIGRVDEIVERHGLDALYSKTLFDFDKDYLQKVGKALEMGRSFIHPDYQRLPQTLDLLWRGIGSYIARNPEYNTLFGAVSISNEHSDLARALISECMLESFCAEQRFLDDVTPVEPLKVSGKIWTNEMLASLNHVSVVNKLVGRCDPGKALPTLLRHYLSLNGKFVCFSINKVFNDSLDGLILVDLRQTPDKYLKRYLGKEGAEVFKQKWQS
jgi:putative hemolysin